MDSELIEKKRAELDAIKAEMEEERERSLIPDPLIQRVRDARRLVLEREVAAWAGEAYADELPVAGPIGDEWHVVSNFGRDTAVICGDVGGGSALLLCFENTEEIRVSGLHDYTDTHLLLGKGLGNTGLFVVRNSSWKRSVLALVAKDALYFDEGWWAGFEHFILRGKGGELTCLARGVESRMLADGIETLRDKARFWKQLKRQA